MILKPTAFIFGAGTSVPYRFPAGEELLRQARALDIENLVNKAEVRAPSDVKELFKALKRTHDSSLDTLLELRPDIAPVGKRLIASLILEFEYHSGKQFPSLKDDWLTVFFGELVRGTKRLEDFVDKNPVWFITYNYDRLLEFRLTGALMAHYGRSEADCIATLRKIPLIHLHGDLGPLPGFADGATVPFGPGPDPAGDFRTYVDRAAQRIVIVHEARGETEDFERARQGLQSVKQVVMLGFGYGESNLSRLDIKRWPKTVFGTRYGLTDNQFLYLATKPFVEVGNGVNTTHPSHGTREFLENLLFIFREP